MTVNTNRTFKSAKAEVEIDPSWVKGIRLWVKKTFATRTYRTAQEALDHLQRVQKVDMEKLGEFLFYDQGLLPWAREKSDTASIPDRLRDKVAEDLKDAREALIEGSSSIRYVINATTPGAWEYETYSHIRHFYETAPPGRLLENVTETANEALKKADMVLSGKMLRFVSSWLTQYAGGVPYEPDSIPLEYSIGKLKVIFDGNFSPVGAKGDARDPRDLQKYVTYMQDAKRLLESKRFGFLWYGQVFITCKDCGGVNQNGAEFGVGAHYRPDKDHIVAYINPGSFMVDLMIHELGHRYYFRFMNQADRARFDMYFGDVPSVSTYGGKSAAEDFAETFLHYVTERNMTRDQIDRFKAFLADKDRGKHASLTSPCPQCGQDMTYDVGVDAFACNSCDYVAGEQQRTSSMLVPQAKVAQRFLERAADAKSTAIMRFLSGVARTHGVGRSVYVVGGAVRNFLLGVPVKDVDIVIDAVALGNGRDSDWFAKVLAGEIPVPTNVTTNQYGVAILTVKGDWELEGIPMKGEVIEIANARKESYSGGGGKGKGYKPTDVVPATIEEDVVRREFTFNTLLWRLEDLAEGPDKAEIIDLTGVGRKHLDEGEIHTPADPDKTFGDDPTRMLRALKFLLKYNLKISPDTAAAIRRNAPKLQNMPWEAVGNILLRDILNTPKAKAALLVMDDLGLIAALAEIIRTTPEFAAFLARQLAAGNHSVDLLLDLADMGIEKKNLSFLSEDQKAKLRTIVMGLSHEAAKELLAALKTPKIDSMALIEEFKLEGRARGTLAPTARALLLEHPEWVHDPEALNAAMRASLGGGGPTVKVAVLTKDEREDRHGDWYAFLVDPSKLALNNVGPGQLKGIPSRRQIDFDPHVLIEQARMPGLDNINRNNTSRDSYAMPHGSTSFGGKPKVVRDVLAALVKANIIENDWEVINAPEFHGQTVGQIIAERRRDVVDEVASKSYGKATFYHGTSALRWETIKVKGLRPGSAHGLPEDRYSDYIKGYSDKNVYLTKSISEAEKYATRSAHADDSSAVVLSVEINDFGRFVMDEDHAAMFWLDINDGVHDGWPPDEAEASGFLKFMYAYKSPTWRKLPIADAINSHFQAKIMDNLKKHGTVAYRGAIAPNKLRVVETYKSVKMKNDPKDDHASVLPESFEKGMVKVRKTVRFPTADLNPPLGVDGGPCRVVDRIRRTVKNPRMREKMIEEVQEGHLPNSEAHQIYPFDREVGSVFKTFTISSHTQYRMDYRSVTVKDVERALNSFAQRLMELQKTDPKRYEAVLGQDTITWVDPRTRLEIVFGLTNGDINLITTFWKGRKDPPPTECSSAVSRVAHHYLMTSGTGG